MKQIPVSELTGPLLAEWGARAQGWAKEPNIDGFVWVDSASRMLKAKWDYRPDIDGGQAMELVKEYGITLFSPSVLGKGRWSVIFIGGRGEGEEPEIAICRAVVASVFGEFVPASA